MILNLTQHDTTSDQMKDGVVEPLRTTKAEIKQLLDFKHIPDHNNILNRATRLASIAVDYEVKEAMIGGAPFFMAPLEAALRRFGVNPVYAFSARVVEEEQLPDGSVKKISKFKHEGLYRP